MKILPTEGMRRPTPKPAIEGAAGPPPPARGADAPAGRESFATVMARLGQRIDQGQHDVDRAARGGQGSNDPGAMIALQAQVYRYVEAVDLASKLVDRVTGAVKTTLQGQ